MIVCLQITDSCIVSWMIYNLLLNLMRIAECHQIKTCNFYVLTHFDVIDWPPCTATTKFVMFFLLSEMKTIPHRVAYAPTSSHLASPV